MTGLVVDGAGFELLAGEERFGRRRVLEATDVGLLEDLASRYARAVRVSSDAGELLELGRTLFAWFRWSVW